MMTGTDYRNVASIISGIEDPTVRAAMAEQFGQELKKRYGRKFNRTQFITSAHEPSNEPRPRRGRGGTRQMTTEKKDTERDHDAEIAKALKVDDLMTVRVQTWDGTDILPFSGAGWQKRLASLPSIDRESLLAESEDPVRGIRIIAGVSRRHGQKSAIADAMRKETGVNGDPNEPGVVIAVAGPSGDSHGDSLTLYTISFQEIMHRVLHHHLKETCAHDPA